LDVPIHLANFKKVFFKILSKKKFKVMFSLVSQD